MRKFSKFLSYLGTTLLWFAACVGILAVLILGEKSTGQDRKAHPIRTYATVTECTSYTGVNSEGEQKTFYRYSGTYETESGEKRPSRSADIHPLSRSADRFRFYAMRTGRTRIRHPRWSPWVCLLS